MSGWHGLRTLGVAGFCLAAAATALDRRAVAPILALACVFPAVIRLGHGAYDPYFAVLWMALLLGAMVPHALGRPWHVPQPWRGPLVVWALTICVSAAVVVAREIDFYPALLSGGVAWRSVGPPPPFMVAWVLQVALSLLLGILWFDWLFGASGWSVERLVIAPLALSAAVMAAVAIYQLTVDLGFLNETVYAYIGRAAGTVYDANLCGTLAALWFGAGVGLSARVGRARPAAIAAMGAVAWLAVWASGSRTGFAAALVVTAFTLAGVMTGRDVRPRSALAQGALLGAAITVAVVGILLLGGRDGHVVGPIARVWQTLPGLSADSLRSFALEMWNRNGYGAAATEAIRQFPLFGIGIGTFHSLGGDFLSAISRHPIPPDNAQNWYRHQFAELGLIGSVGWIAFVAAFVGFMIKCRRASWPETAPLQGVLVALGLISLVGMPGQHVIVGITFWTIAFWFVSMSRGEAAAGPISRYSWAAIAVAVAVFAAGSARLAAHELRPPMRAQRAGWPYSVRLLLARAGWTRR